MKFHNRFKEVRNQKGLTMAQLANRLGLPNRQMVDQWEKAESMQLRTFVRILNALEIEDVSIFFS